MTTWAKENIIIPVTAAAAPSNVDVLKEGDTWPGDKVVCSESSDSTTRWYPGSDLDTDYEYDVYLDSVKVGRIRGNDSSTHGKISTTLTTEQFRLSYDATNYMTVTIADDGRAIFVTVDPDGAEADICLNPDGDVIIGATTNPGAKLEVVGDILSKGTSWTIRTSAADNNWYGVTYGNGLFVAVAYSGVGNRVMTSGKQDYQIISHDNIYQGGMSIFGNVGFGTTDPQGNTQWSSADTHGELVLKTYSATGTISVAHTITIQTNVPVTAKIIGAQLHVLTALAGGETWNAQYVTGATQSIGTAQAVAQNTNLSKFFDVNTDTDIASGEVDVTIQRSSNPGVDAFTAQGVIECVVYAWIFDTWDNE